MEPLAYICLFAPIIFTLEFSPWELELFTLFNLQHLDAILLMSPMWNDDVINLTQNSKPRILRHVDGWSSHFVGWRKSMGFKHSLAFDMNASLFSTMGLLMSHFEPTTLPISNYWEIEDWSRYLEFEDGSLSTPSIEILQIASLNSQFEL